MTALRSRAVLAAWCREDGHSGCGDLIEFAPARMLPSVLRWSARHIERHPVFDDAAARWLPEALRQNAEWRAASRQPIGGIPTAILLVGMFAFAYMLEAHLGGN